MKSYKFCTGDIYHVFNKSIANFNIFGNLKNAERFTKTLDYYNSNFLTESYSSFLKRKEHDFENLIYPKKSANVKFLSYCVMPDHYHSIIKIMNGNILSKYISDVENSYTRFFNIKSKRKGPLWQSRFKAIRIESNEQLLHVSRYIHLNPVTNNLVKVPEDWKFSSYRSIITNKNVLKDVLIELSIDSPEQYRRFVTNNADYQRKLKLIKKLMID